SLTNNLASVPLPKVPSLPLSLPQMPSFSAPAWMGPLCESTPDIDDAKRTHPHFFGLVFLLNHPQDDRQDASGHRGCAEYQRRSSPYQHSSLNLVLDALQSFVLDLHWPEPEFAKHLEQRLKLMASDMMEACVKRTKSAFDAKMQKACKSTDFRVPLSVCTMFNVLMDAKKQCSKLCVLDTGQEVRGGHTEETSTLQGAITLCCSLASS
ncbi:hypothetical protein KUCAC02_032493, partial [Chaenocephalus aceratus]